MARLNQELKKSALKPKALTDKAEWERKQEGFETDEEDEDEEKKQEENVEGGNSILLSILLARRRVLIGCRSELQRCKSREKNRNRKNLKRKFQLLVHESRDVNHTEVRKASK